MKKIITKKFSILIFIGIFVYFLLMHFINNYICQYDSKKAVVMDYEGNVNEFKKNGGIYNTTSELEMCDYYGSEGCEDGATYQSPWYKSEALAEIYVAGYAENENVHLFMQTDTGEYEYNITSGEKWSSALFDTRGSERFRFVAIDNSSEGFDWLAISEPYVYSYDYLFLYDLKPFLEIPGFILLFVMWMLPGYGIAGLLYKKKIICEKYVSIVAVVSISCLSYFLFYIRMILGKYIDQVVILFWVIGIIIFLKHLHDLKQIRLKYDLVQPLIFILVLFFFYFSILFIYSTQLGYDDLFLARRYMPTVDNEFPMAFVQKVCQGESLDSLLLGWQTSDRPPVMASLFYTISVFVSEENFGHLYLIQSMFLALGIWIGIWDLFKLLNFSDKQRRYCMITISFSGLVCMNTIFTWPKFLAASYFLFAFMILIKWSCKEDITYAEQIIVGLCMGLAFLSHGTIAFAILAYGCLLLLRREVRWKQTIIILVSFLALYLPWNFYQKFVAPPGDILLRAYLAGSWERSECSLWEQLVVSYSMISFPAWISGRLKNMIAFFCVNISSLLLYVEGIWDKIWVLCWGALFPNIGVDICLWLNAKKWKKMNSIEKVIVYQLPLCMIISSVLYFTPWETCNHQCAYSNIIILYIATAIFAKEIKNNKFFNLISFKNIIFIILALPIRGEISKNHPGYSDIFYRVNYFAVGFVIITSILTLIYIIKKTDFHIRKNEILC